MGNPTPRLCALLKHWISQRASPDKNASRRNMQRAVNRQPWFLRGRLVETMTKETTNCIEQCKLAMESPESCNHQAARHEHVNREIRSKRTWTHANSNLYTGVWVSRNQGSTRQIAYTHTLRIQINLANNPGGGTTTFHNNKNSFLR